MTCERCGRGMWLGPRGFECGRRAPCEPSLCWDVKVGWVPVREIDPATGRTAAQELADANVAFNS